jgi:hypothetical protein
MPLRATQIKMIPHTTAMNIQSPTLNPNIGSFSSYLDEKPDGGDSWPE